MVIGYAFSVELFGRAVVVGPGKRNFQWLSFHIGRFYNVQEVKSKSFKMCKCVSLSFASIAVVPHPQCPAMLCSENEQSRRIGSVRVSEANLSFGTSNCSMSFRRNDHECAIQLNSVNNLSLYALTVKFFLHFLGISSS